MSPVEEDLAGLVAELKALPERHRRQILSVLTPFERAGIASLLDAPGDRQGTGDTPAAARNVGFSPAIARRIEDADGPAAGGGAPAMTGATRALVLRLAKDAEARDVPDRVATPAPNGKSLLANLGARLGRSRS